MSLLTFLGGPNGRGKPKTRAYTFSTIERKKGEDPHIGSCMNKATNQVSLNLTFFPSWSYLEQMHTHGIESRYLGLNSFPVIRCPVLGSSAPPAHCYTELQACPSIHQWQGKHSGEYTRLSKQVFHLFPQLRTKVGALTWNKSFQFFLAAYRNAQIFFQIKASHESKGWGSGLSFLVG